MNNNIFDDIIIASKHFPNELCYLSKLLLDLLCELIEVVNYLF